MTVRGLSMGLAVLVGAGPAVTRVPGESRLSTGMEIVVLDVKVRRNGVHLFTHTSEPIMSGGAAAYGCTDFDGDELRDVERIQQEIGRWLESA